MRKLSILSLKCPFIGHETHFVCQSISILFLVLGMHWKLHNLIDINIHIFVFTLTSLPALLIHFRGVSSKLLLMVRWVVEFSTWLYKVILILSIKWMFTMDRQWCPRKRPLGKTPELDLGGSFQDIFHLERPLRPL